MYTHILIFFIIYIPIYLCFSVTQFQRKTEDAEAIDKNII